MDQIMPQADAPHHSWCVGWHTIYLEVTDWEDEDQQSAETSLDEKAHRNYLGCWLINSDQNVCSISLTNHGVCIRYMGNGHQDQQEQAGQGPEQAQRVILGAMKTTPVHDMGPPLRLVGYTCLASIAKIKPLPSIQACRKRRLRWKPHLEVK